MSRDFTYEKIYPCTDCGGEARYVHQHKGVVKNPCCEVCRKLRAAASSKRWALKIKLSVPEAQALRSNHYRKKAAPMAVVYVNPDGTKRLIRTLPTKLLATIVFQTGKITPMLLAACQELRTRQIGDKTRAKINQILPPPCACGGPGLYIVGSTTYCDKCYDTALRRRTRYTHDLDVRQAEKGAALQEQQQEIDSALRHHNQMKNRRRP